MRLFKRSKTWWADFSVNGQRFRLALDTTDKREATRTANSKLTSAQQGRLSASSASFARLTFTEASEKYLASRKLELAPSSLTKETQLCVKLREYFGPTRLNKITSESLINYREWRAATCGPAIVNGEIGCARRILKRAKLWAALADDVRPLREPATIGRSLSPAEKTALLEAAALKPEWETAFYAAQIALNTTMRGCEIKGLRWADVDLLAGTLSIRKGKTLAASRVIPLTPDAFEVFVQLRKRAELFGEVALGHYIFASFKLEMLPKGKGNRVTAWQPDSPIGSWRTAWRKLTAKAGLPGLRFHDLRHATITSLLTNPNVSVQTVKSLAGHVSQRMVDRYAHIGLTAKQSALEALSTSTDSTIVVTQVTGNYGSRGISGNRGNPVVEGLSGRGNGTNNGTKTVEADCQSA
jgi:integrase